MGPSRLTRIRRLVRDLSRPDTRTAALTRIRRKPVSVIRNRLVGPPPAKPAHKGPDPKYVEAWSRLAEIVVQRPVSAEATALDVPTSKEALARARRSRAEALFAASVARGESLEDSVRRSVGALAASGDWDDWNAGWALAEGVAALPQGKTASALGHAVLLHRRRQFDRVWNVIRDLDDATLRSHIPVEAVDAALAQRTPDARGRALEIASRPDAMEPEVAVDLAGRLLAYDERASARELVTAVRDRADTTLDVRRRHALGLIEGWLDERGAASAPAGSIPLGILDYGTPDHVLTSGNLGDYIQTLALIGNLVRFSDVAFSGEDGLGDVASEMKAHVRNELRVPGVAGSIHLLPVDRDFSSGRDVPEGTWMFAFGWHMHPLFDLRYDFPYHPNIRPLFVSFHVNRLDMLSGEALAYLKRHGPVGCRDWSTVFLLLSAGIDAFFTGCLTTTVDALFPGRDGVYQGSGVVGLIDKPPRRGRAGETARAYSHQADDYAVMSAAEGVRAAHKVLSGYQRELRRAVTGRLHAYLPLTSIGVPVEFTTTSPGDVRFAGLMGLQPGDERLLEMQGGIRDLTARILERIVAGASESEVYVLWRELTAGAVADAKDRFAAPVADVPTTIDVPAAVATTRTGSRRLGPHDSVDRTTVTDVVLSFDQNLTLAAAVLVESLVANASRPLRLWILARGLGATYQEWLGAAFPALPLTFLPCDSISYGPGGRPRRVPARITVSTMDRLLLPEMLDDVDRAVYLDTDTLMLDDVCRLGRIDLGGYPLAARDSTVIEASEWQRAGRRLPEDLATELRRRLGHRHGYGQRALNAGVLVMDLERMRTDDFTRTYLGWVERYGLHDQDTLLAYVGPERAVIDPRWNAMPVLEDVADPGLIHWASFGKPWDANLTYAQDEWRTYAAQLHRRAGPPPAVDQAHGRTPGAIATAVELRTATVPVAPAVEQVIVRVLQDHLSYLGEPGLRNLAATVEAIESDGIDGLIVEAGAALGGSAITMAAAKSPVRPMKVYDVFDMIPAPSERDGADVHRRYETIVKGASKGIGGDIYYGYREDLLAEVTDTFSRYGLPLAENNVELVQGLFQDTIALDEAVALAHLDGDWYESTMTCLTRIAPRLSTGGRIVVDDYDTWSGCRAAVDEYFAGRQGYRFERRGRLHIVRV